MMRRRVQGVVMRRPMTAREIQFYRFDPWGD
jgi:hypothetical protein